MTAQFCCRTFRRSLGSSGDQSAELLCCLAWQPHCPADGSLAWYLFILRVLLSSDPALSDHLLRAPKHRMQLFRAVYHRSEGEFL